MSEHTEIEAQVRAWIDRFVVGLGLCPFARQPVEGEQVKIVVSPAHDSEALLEELQQQLLWLDAQPPRATETTLIVVKEMLGDFLDYNDFLDLADALLINLGWDGRFQFASFHPDYQFAGTDPDDAENYTNRAPWPILQLLREDSLETVLASYPNPGQIPERNIAAMNRLGSTALAELLQKCREAKPK
ncbi:hypothetical protein GCM10011403_16850 [Pseudohongiella nitratireducens]|uniref:DUF1415 domain-containing protein n=1 Tax=Pseudohongiella nitratireducens TaxID=1768907 RepID=A0A917GY75_9GAMM|nr:DUF1415 domain-containing protein [Pseudohongiella nitratireducens]MDF1622037.1 DUF1415 domain-containing protein [Pseudohongiella nitratireducens]GGG60171.1 hypothetical protein GCM10011403_16850 [Pseudohongiella nitratireducens]